MPLETILYTVGTLFLLAGGITSSIMSKNIITIQFAIMFTYINYLLFIHAFVKGLVK